MPSQIFINLAVSDLERSTNFYTQMGFTVNTQFSDDTAKCLVWSDTIFVMIMTKEKFSSFATKPLADTKNNLAAFFALSVESPGKMNDVISKAIAAGGTEPKPMQDHGFMQLRNIEDLDGHTWEIFYMDMAKIPADQNEHLM
jgi:uncharacterized protein